MYDFLNIKYSFLLIGLKYNSGYGLVSQNLLFPSPIYTLFIRSSDVIDNGSYCSVIIRETFIEGSSEGLGTVWGVWVGGWGSSGLNWLSLDHHGDGDVVVVGGVLGLGSVLLSDGLEGVITDNLSERFKGDGVNAIEGVGWGNLKGEGSLLINWDGNELGVGSEDFGIGEFGSSKGLHGVGEVSVGGGSSFELGHGLGDEGHGVLVLNSSGLSACKGSKGGEFHFVYYYYKLKN